MSFDITKRDPQATEIVPVAPERFDLEAYADYEQSLLEKCAAFWNAPRNRIVSLSIFDIFFLQR